MALPKRWINVTDPGWILSRGTPRVTAWFSEKGFQMVCDDVIEESLARIAWHIRGE